MWLFDLMGCSDSRRRRRSNKSYPSLLGAEEPAMAGVVEPVVMRAKSSRLPQWRPGLAAISEDGAALSADDDAVGRRASPALAMRGSVKTSSSRIRPQAAEIRSSWHHNNQTAMPSLAPGAFFRF